MRDDMTANLAFEGHLVRVVPRDGQPWFIGKDVCAALDLRNHNDALGKLDEDERAEVGISDPSGTKRAIAISEPGVYRLTFSSRKPEAERFKRWLAHDVLPQLRRTGSYGEAPALAASTDAPSSVVREPLMHRLQVVREARSLYGRDVARILWRKLGLPDVPPPPPSAMDEARTCLRHLLDADVHDGGPTIRACLEQALDDSLEHQALLRAAGVAVMPEHEAFAVANEHPWLRRVFKGTDWAGTHGHMRVLRRLPGVGPGRQHRYGDHVQRRGTLVPADYLDEEYHPCR